MPIRPLAACVFFCVAIPCLGDEPPGHTEPSPDIDQHIQVSGLIASGTFVQNSEGEAYRSWQRSCANLERLLRQTLEDFRLSRFDCGTPTNNQPFERESGLRFFMFQSRPSFSYAVDPGDVVIQLLGPEIIGAEAPQYRLVEAFSSFNQLCAQKITELRARHASRFVVASCGDAAVHKRMVYSPDHGRELPQLQVSAQMKVWLRDGAEHAEPSPIPLTPYALLSGQHGYVFAIAFLRDVNGYVPLSVDSSGTVVRWDVSNQRIAWTQSLRDPTPRRPGDERPLLSIGSSPNGRTIVVGGDFGYLVELNATDGQVRRQLDATAEEGVHYAALGYSSDSRFLLTGSHRLGQFPFDSNYNDIRFPSPLDRSLPSQIRLWDAENGEMLREMSYSGAEILGVGFSQSGRFVYAVAKDGVRIFHQATGEVRREILTSHIDPFIEHSMISGASFSPDWQFLAVATFSGVTIIDTETGEPIKRLRARLDFPLGNPLFMDDLRTVRASDAFGHLFEWNLGTGRLSGAGSLENTALAYNGRGNMPLTYSPDQRWLVVGATIGFSGGIGVYIPPEFGVMRDGPESPGRSIGGIRVWAIERPPGQ